MIRYRMNENDDYIEVKEGSNVECLEEDQVLFDLLKRGLPFSTHECDDPVTVEIEGYGKACLYPQLWSYFSRIVDDDPVSYEYEEDNREEFYGTLDSLAMHSKSFAVRSALENHLKPGKYYLDFYITSDQSGDERAVFPMSVRVIVHDDGSVVAMDC